MAAGRSDATGLSATGRTAWTLDRVIWRVTAGLCTAALTDSGGKIPQRRNLRFIRYAVRG